MDVCDKYSEIFRKVNHDDDLEDVLPKVIEDGVLTRGGGQIRVSSPSVAYDLMFSKTDAGHKLIPPYLESRIMLDKTMGSGKSEAFFRMSKPVGGPNGGPDGTMMASSIIEAASAANGLKHCGSLIMPYCRRNKLGDLTVYGTLESDAITALAYAMECEDKQSKATMALLDEFNGQGLNAHLVPIDGYDGTKVILVASRRLPLGMMMYSLLDGLDSDIVYTVNLPIGGTLMRVANDNEPVHDEGLLDAIINEDSKLIVSSTSLEVVRAVMGFLEGNSNMIKDYGGYAMTRSEVDGVRESYCAYSTDDDWDKNEAMSYYKLYE